MIHVQIILFLLKKELLVLLTMQLLELFLTFPGMMPGINIVMSKDGKNIVMSYDGTHDSRS